ncbi:DUF3949 domain-containing protein [Neobacillus mesonae]|uniref:DUF3949 domain-containing protein n=1 Tax=Neobacillus mesonae TaxID=1193713 RepID=UPI0025723465|nr:DUF3949 domain-containing protein [Neobacillus mesonae]MED4206509.1 DUF3949 domain-containing protein [Neobacillus mesonae]
MDLVLLVCLSVYAVYCLIMIPIQYANIGETKKRFKKLNKSHNEIYDEMTFVEQQQQFNLQGNLMNLVPTLIATFIYKIKSKGRIELSP